MRQISCIIIRQIIYPGPYRLADVEDLICNTMGCDCSQLIFYYKRRLWLTAFFFCDQNS